MAFAGVCLLHTEKSPCIPMYNSTIKLHEIHAGAQMPKGIIYFPNGSLSADPGLTRKCPVSKAVISHDLWV